MNSYENSVEYNLDNYNQMDGIDMPDMNRNEGPPGLTPEGMNNENSSMESLEIKAEGNQHGEPRPIDPSAGEGRRQHSRRGGRGRNNNNTSQSYGRSVPNSREVKVGGQSNPKSVAGSIAHLIRAGNTPEVLAVGDSSVNQAVKAIAIARNYLRDERMDICFQPELINTNQFDFGVSFIIHQAYNRSAQQEKFALENSDTVKVASKSVPGTVAGSIAGRLRDGKRVSVGAIGATNVGISVKSIIYAREYLKNDCIDIYVKPDFVSTGDTGESRTGIRLGLLATQL